MIPTSYAEKHYASAESRFLRGALEGFFQREFSRFFGPLVLNKIVEELLKLVEALAPQREHLKPGQCLWLAVDAQTRADSPKRRVRPVVLTLIAEADVKRLASGTAMPEIASEAIARIMREAHAQGALLSMRDIELLSWRSSGTLTTYRKRYEAEHECVLPHTGSLHDMGSCITHKRHIVRKAVQQKKDPRTIARESNHTVKAVERYINDYQRVKQCYKRDPSVEYISTVTGIAKHVVKQYIDLVIEFGAPTPEHS